MSASKSWTPWSSEEDATLREIYADLTISAPAKTASEKLGRIMAAVSLRACKLRITRSTRNRMREHEPAPAQPEPVVVNRWQPRPKRPLETVPDFLRDSFTEFAQRRPAS